MTAQGTRGRWSPGEVREDEGGARDEGEGGEGAEGW